MAEPALAYPPRPCPALDAILSLHEDSLPCTDDQPMADADEQERPLSYSRSAIRRHLRGLHEDVAVYGDMFVYYIGRDDRGGPVRRWVAPDVFAVFGTPYRLNRRSYVLWDEPEADMRFVLEIASSSTRGHDHGAKRDIYASLGVREYFLYDPPGPRRPAALAGLRLCDGAYQEIPPVALPDGRPGVRSGVLGLVGHVGEGRGEGAGCAGSTRRPARTCATSTSTRIGATWRTPTRDGLTPPNGALPNSKTCCASVSVPRQSLSGLAGRCAGQRSGDAPGLLDRQLVA